MREVSLDQGARLSEAASFAACLATILEVDLESVPEPTGADALDWRIARWLGREGRGLVRVFDVEHFAWAGPWLAWVTPAGGGERRAVVMYGVPSGVAWDPCGVTAREGWRRTEGFVVAALDIALSRLSSPEAPTEVGTVDSIWIADKAGAVGRAADSAQALSGRGLAGDRHVSNAGTFPSGLPGSALTLIEAEVCESFVPPLKPSEHRRNIVTRGIEVARLVGSEFLVGDVRCRGVRLCEPCAVIERYASRPVLRQLVHRGGLRADILADGVIRAGDRVVAVAAGS